MENCVELDYPGDSTKEKMQKVSYENFTSTVGPDGQDLDSIGEVTADFKIEMENFNLHSLYQEIINGKFVGIHTIKFLN